MRDSNALVHLGALELENILRFATGDAHFIGPSADAGFGIKDQSNRAGDHIELSINAEVEFIAYARLLVAKIAILTWTVLRGLRGFCEEGALISVASNEKLQNIIYYTCIRSLY